MSIQRILEENQNIQSSLLDFIDDESNTNENFQTLQKFFNDYKIREDLHKLKSLLLMLVKISNDHHRIPDLYVKIEQILLFFFKRYQKILFKLRNFRHFQK